MESALKSAAVRFGWQWFALILVSLVVVGFAEYHVALSRHERGQYERERLERQSLVVSAAISQQLQAASHSLDAIRGLIAASPERVTERQFVERLDAIQRSVLGVRSFAVVNADGFTISASRHDLVGLNMQDSERYAVIKSGNDPDKLYVTEPFHYSVRPFVVARNGD